MSRSDLEAFFPNKKRDDLGVKLQLLRQIIEKAVISL